MKDSIYKCLRATFVPASNLTTVQSAKFEDFEFYTFNAEKVAALGGIDHENFACFKDGKLLWVSHFPQGVCLGGNITGFTTFFEEGKIRLTDFFGSIYEVEISTGAFKCVGWTK